MGLWGRWAWPQRPPAGGVSLAASAVESAEFGVQHLEMLVEREPWAAPWVSVVVHQLRW